MHEKQTTKRKNAFRAQRDYYLYRMYGPETLGSLATENSRYFDFVCDLANSAVNTVANSHVACTVNSERLCGFLLLPFACVWQQTFIVDRYIPESERDSVVTVAQGQNEHET